MASLTKKADSPFWQLKWKSPTGWKRTTTALRHDDPNDTAKAHELRAKAEAAEYRESAPATQGWGWVEAFFASCGSQPRTIERYAGGWRWVQLFLSDQRIGLTAIRYHHVHKYIEWRVGRKKKTGKRAGRNTAIQEVKILAMVMGEAVRREMIPANPLAELKLRRDPAPKKRAFTDDEITRCRAALATCPDWMQIAFEISLCTGCRLSDTRIPLSSIDLDSTPPTMTFPVPKGGPEKAFSIPIPTQLLPMFRKMKRDKRAFTFDAFPFQPSRRWQQFFEVVGIEGVCFHCLRVTKITRMRREGVPREVAMRLVNHSSELIHQLYDRHQVRDLAKWADSGIAGSAASK